MNKGQKVQQCTRAPRLRRARIVAEIPVLVGKLRQSSPGILLYVSSCSKKQIMQVMQRMLGILQEMVRMESIKHHHNSPPCRDQHAGQSKGKPSGSILAASPTPVPSIQDVRAEMQREILEGVHCGSSILWRSLHHSSRLNYHKSGGTADRLDPGSSCLRVHEGPGPQV